MYRIKLDMNKWRQLKGEVFFKSKHMSIQQM